MAIVYSGVVALRKESVDRNAGGFPTIKAMRGSLSARRAWIEISARHTAAPRKWVALRKESVDRNGFDIVQLLTGHVALRKESVDRNMSREMSLIRPYGRSPQGERG